MNIFNRELFWQKTAQEKKEHEDMVKSIIKTCLTSTAVVLFCIVIFETYFFINSLIHPKSFGALGVWYRTCYLTLCIASIISMILGGYAWVNYEKKYKIIQILSPIYSAIIIAWCLAITYLDCLKNERCSPILFMTIVLCIPACIYINPLYYLIVDLIGSVIMLWIVIYAPGGGNTADMLNFIVFMIIEIIVSIFFLSTKYGYVKYMRQGILNEQKARKTVEAKAATLSSMSHELRTPLNSILGMNEIMIRDDKNGELSEYTDSIQLAGDTMLRLINDMLDFSKLEAGKMKLNIAAFSLYDVLERVYNIMSILAEKKKLEFSIVSEESTPNHLIGDSQKLQQLMINLINNAIKYTREGSVKMTVRIQGQDFPRLMVEIIDTGIGIKEQDIPYLFDSYSQFDDEANRHIEGTGLGLMICDRFVKMMDGEIGVRSTYGEGSVFWFNVPCIVEDRVAMKQSLWNEKPSRREKKADITIAGNEKNFNILVIDDTPMNLEIFGKFLEKEPVNVDKADSGFLALKMIENKKYDMIFIDHLMPEMDGVETLKKIRESENLWCRDVKIIALTANAGNGAREEYLALGFDDYLSKPIVLKNLLNIIK